MKKGAGKIYTRSKYKSEVLAEKSLLLSDANLTIKPLLA